MFRIVHVFCVLVVFAAADTAFAAPSPDESRSRPETVKRRVKKQRAVAAKKTRKKVVEKAAPIATPPVAVVEVSKKVETAAGDLRWTDPLALRDTLFLSTAARRARVEAGVAEEEKRDVTK
jgi:hypothetical protein